MQCWAESKQQPGQFTGSTGVKVLSQAELSSGFQAWARKVSNSLLVSFCRTSSCKPLRLFYLTLGY